MRKLHRYWIEFEADFPNRFGVTAYSEADALMLLKVMVFDSGKLPAIRQWMTDVDISTLDTNHILPIMGMAIRRGIWFPQGYDLPHPI